MCGVYAPNANCPESRKTSFYEELNSTTFLFQKRPGHCILAGDFNARIGDISGDHATNSNMNHFLDFIADHPPLINVNNLMTYGHYTFRNISNGSCSIIDYLLTDLHSSRILEHKVLGGDLGTSAQTAHKALFSKIRITMEVKNHPRLRKRPAWRSLTDHNLERYQTNLKAELFRLTVRNVNYKTLRVAINRAKTNSLGRKRPSPQNSTNSNPEIDHLEMILGIALEEYRANPTLTNLKKAQN